MRRASLVVGVCTFVSLSATPAAAAPSDRPTRLAVPDRSAGESNPFDDLRVAFGYDSVAARAATVVAPGGRARFTVLTPRTVRMEFSEGGQFEDRATIAIVNRALPVPAFNATHESGILTIKTASVIIRYDTSKVFSSTSLTATVGGANDPNWHFGKPDAGNLLGTIKSLDGLCNPSLNCADEAHRKIHNESLHCAWGTVSRGGWTTINDTANYVIGGGSAPPTLWFDNALRGASAVDVYLIAHGSQPGSFKAALGDFAKISGAPAMPSRPLFGVWFTRWYDYDASDVKRVVGLFESAGMPLDTWVFDMNWHKKNGWTGFSWDRQLFPYPGDTVAFLHGKGLRIAANIHDDGGVGKFEDLYEPFCRAVGVDPNETRSAVPFAPLSKRYMHSLEDVVMAPLGLDAWWIDWQQGGAVHGCAGGQMNPTIITNHVRATDPARRHGRAAPTRGDILARWGGLGSQRYPIGFSGDVLQLSWECFAYQPYFSATAGNVAFSQVSHDLVGPASDPELYVRWLQFGAFSGTMRLHDRGMSAGGCQASRTCAIDEPWKLTHEYRVPARAAMLARAAMVPYTYTAALRAFLETGVPLLRALYIDFPTETEAYRMKPDGAGAQYMFGDDISVAPVVTPMAAPTVSRSVWVPPGVWFDAVYGELIRGPIKGERRFALGDVPTLVRAGAVVPRVPTAFGRKIGSAATAFPPLDFHVVPGAQNGTGFVLEDDGRTMAYATATAGFRTVVKTTVTVRRTPTSAHVMIDAPPLPANAGAPASRQMRILFIASAPLRSVRVAAGVKRRDLSFSSGDSGEGSATSLGAETPLSRRDSDAAGEAATPSFSYDGARGIATVTIGEVAGTGAKVTVDCEFMTEDAAAAGVPGRLLMHRAPLYFSRADVAKRITDEFRQTPCSVGVCSGFVKRTASVAQILTHFANPEAGSAGEEKFIAAVRSYPTLVQQAIEELLQWEALSPVSLPKRVIQMDADDRRPTTMDAVAPPSPAVQNALRDAVDLFTSTQS